MRDVKFRAYDKKQNKIFYDGDFYNKNYKEESEAKKHSYPCLITNIGIIYDTKLSKDLDNNYIELIQNERMQTYYKNWELTIIHSEDIELMQYTGVRDVDEREIYEGDIVETSLGKYKVIWDKYRFNLENFGYATFDYPTEAFSEYIGMKIIGNIFEDHELLKEVK